MSVFINFDFLENREKDKVTQTERETPETLDIDTYR